MTTLRLQRCPEHASSSSEDGEPPDLVSRSETDDDDDDLPGLAELEEGCRQLELAPSLEPVPLGPGNHRIQALQALYALLPDPQTDPVTAWRKFCINYSNDHDKFINYASNTPEGWSGPP